MYGGELQELSVWQWFGRFWVLGWVGVAVVQTPCALSLSLSLSHTLSLSAAGRGLHEVNEDVEEHGLQWRGVVGFL